MKLKSYLFLAGLSFSAFSFAQQYTVQTTQETYQELQNPTSLTDGMIWDDDVFGIELPFSFSIGSTTLDSVFVLEGGISSSMFAMELDEGIITSDQLATVVGLGADMVDRGEHDGGTPLSPISYEFLTENGNEVLVVEFKNMGFFDEDVTTTSMDYVNMQIRLIEGNTIEIHYGSSNVSAPVDYFDNGQGNVVAIMPNYEVTLDSIIFNEDIYVLEGSPAAPTIDIISNIDDLENEEQGLDGFPTDGTKYIFSTSTVGQDEFNQSAISVVNPMQNTLEFSSDKPVNRIEVSNVQGQIVLSSTSVNQIDVSGLMTGTYFAKFYDGVQPVAVKKMVKQ